LDVTIIYLLRDALGHWIKDKERGKRKKGKKEQGKKGKRKRGKRKREN